MRDGYGARPVRRVACPACGLSGAAAEDRSGAAAGGRDSAAEDRSGAPAGRQPHRAHQM